jgi:DNA-binding response OmpR family regulator
VTDTGIGIPQNKLPYIFDRFFHMEDELEHGESGVGIGLSLVQELVKLLKGSISVNSIPGTGTTFTVMLPYTNHAKAEYSLQESFPEDELTSDFFENGSFPSGNSGKDDLLSLLIVEDNRDVTEYLTDCLEDEYQLLFAVDGQEGLEMTLKEMPDIIISDVMMPRLDGLSMCKEIKNDERTSHIPVIMLTAKADVHSRIEGLEYGADVYLAKPFHKRELQVQLRNLVLIRSRLHERYANLENLQDTLDKSTKKEDTFVLGLRETILESIDEEEFGVPELCRKIGMSRTQLHNKIKALTDLSTSKFIRKIRIDQAAQLLRTTDMSISQVAFEVGVESLTYFTKIFTEEIGLPPSKYRRKKYLEQ